MSDFEFNLTDENFWVPGQCRDWPDEAQPRFYFRVPTAAETQNYDRELASIKDKERLDDITDVFGSAAILNLWLKTSLTYLTRVENAKFNGAPVDWSSMDEDTKRSFLQKLASDGRSRLFALANLVQTIRVGMEPSEKKSSKTTSDSAGDLSSPDAPAKSAQETTTLT